MGVTLHLPALPAGLLPQAADLFVAHDASVGFEADLIWAMQQKIPPPDLGEVRARLCPDGSCPGGARIGRVLVSCTHPDHARQARVRELEIRRRLGLLAIPLAPPPNPG